MSVNNGFSKGYSFTMAAAAGSATVSLSEGYSRAYLIIPTLTSSSALDVYAASDGGTIYYQLRHSPTGSTATVVAPSFIVAASCMAAGGVIPLPAGFTNYKIFATDSAPSAALGFTLLVNQS